MINVDEDPAETDNAMDYEGSIVTDASSAAFDDLDSSQSTIVSGNIVQKLNEEVELEPLRGSYVGSTEANDVNPQMEKKGIVSNPVRKQYSTTSSVYAEHTISNPNAEQLLFW